MILRILAVYIIIINTAAYIMYGADKRRAEKNKWRLSEKSLFAVCLLGGTVGGMLGMKVFRHKTKHLKFKIGLPALFILQLCLTALLFISAVNIHIENYSKPYLCLPEYSVEAIIVPGARVHNDSVSAVLAARLDAAAELYFQKTAPKILVTGDHGTKYYDEVSAMRKYLVEKGVPEEDIFMDHAGFDTYSSMYRARDIFMIHSAVVTSQNYHNIRAVYIGRKLGTDVFAYAAEDVYIGRLAPYREAFARVKAFWEVNTGQKPKYLGEPIPVSGDGRVTAG